MKILKILLVLIFSLFVTDNLPKDAEASGKSYISRSRTRDSFGQLERVARHRLGLHPLLYTKDKLRKQLRNLINKEKTIINQLINSSYVPKEKQNEFRDQVVKHLGSDVNNLQERVKFLSALKHSVEKTLQRLSASEADKGNFFRNVIINALILKEYHPTESAKKIIKSLRAIMDNEGRLKELYPNIPSETVNCFFRKLAPNIKVSDKYVYFFSGHGKALFENFCEFVGSLKTIGVSEQSIQKEIRNLLHLIIDNKAFKHISKKVLKALNRERSRKLEKFFKEFSLRFKQEFVEYTQNNAAQQASQFEKFLLCVSRAWFKTQDNSHVNTLIMLSNSEKIFLFVSGPVPFTSNEALDKLEHVIGFCKNLFGEEMLPEKTVEIIDIHSFLNTNSNPQPFIEAIQLLFDIKDVKVKELVNYIEKIQSSTLLNNIKKAIIVAYKGPGIKDDLEITFDRVTGAVNKMIKEWGKKIKEWKKKEPLKKLEDDLRVKEIIQKIKSVNDSLGELKKDLLNKSDIIDDLKNKIDNINKSLDELEINNINKSLDDLKNKIDISSRLENEISTVYDDERNFKDKADKEMFRDINKKLLELLSVCQISSSFGEAKKIAIDLYVETIEKWEKGSISDKECIEQLYNNSELKSFLSDDITEFLHTEKLALTVLECLQMSEKVKDELLKIKNCIDDNKDEEFDKIIEDLFSTLKSKKDKKELSIIAKFLYNFYEFVTYYLFGTLKSKKELGVIEESLYDTVEKLNTLIKFLKNKDVKDAEEDVKDAEEDVKDAEKDKSFYKKCVINKVNFILKAYDKFNFLKNSKIHIYSCLPICDTCKLCIDSSKRNEDLNKNCSIYHPTKEFIPESK